VESKRGDAESAEEDAEDYGSEGILGIVAAVYDQECSAC